MTYQCGLTVHASNLAKFTTTIIRSSKDSVDPDTIEVHRKNASFAKDGGAVCCYDSIIKFVEIITTYLMDFGATQTSKIPAVEVTELDIFGHHKQTWEADDPLSGSTPQTDLEVTKDDTKEDVVPTPTGTNMLDTGTQPLSTITMTEAFGDYNLTTDADLEAVNQVLSAYENTLLYKHNAEKLKSMTMRHKPILLTPTRPLYRKYEIRKVPAPCQFIDDYVFYGTHITAIDKGNKNNPLNPNIATTSISHIYVIKQYKYFEFNPWFDQRRM